MIRPHPSSSFGISLVPISWAPRTNKALTKAPCGAGRWAISSRYSLTIAAAPAAFGVAIEVPVYSRYQLFDQVEPEVSVASCARHERTYPPGAMTSGLILPSSVGPRLEPLIKVSGAPE